MIWKANNNEPEFFYGDKRVVKKWALFPTEVCKSGESYYIWLNSFYQRQIFTGSWMPGVLLSWQREETYPNNFYWKYEAERDFTIRMYDPDKSVKDTTPIGILKSFIESK